MPTGNVCDREVGHVRKWDGPSTIPAHTTRNLLYPPKNSSILKLKVGAVTLWKTIGKPYPELQPGASQ